MKCKFEHKCVKVYIPAKEHIPFFYEFIDLMVHYGYNTLMMEVGGAMEYKNHPEINEGWIEYCQKFTEYQGQSWDAQRSKPWVKNSIHMENGGGNFLPQATVKELIKYCNDRGIKVIPEVPSLSHCDYLLTRHMDLAERDNDDLADTFCPSNPDSYKLLFEVLDEVIEVFNPDVVQIGHDEFYSFGICDKCKGKDPAKLYADDIIKIYNYLKERGIKTQMWGEKFLNAVTKAGAECGGSERHIKFADGSMQIIPATYTSIDLVPRDIIIDHWYWSLDEDWEDEFIKRGFKTYFSNFHGTQFTNFYKRYNKGISGISISNWSLLNCDHMQRNRVFFDIAYADRLEKGIESEYNQACIEVSDELYNYRTRNFKNMLEITHNADVMFEHKPFVDGYMIDKESDYLGKYVVKFTDGTCMDIPLYYGLNIGTSQAGFAPSSTTTGDGVQLESSHILEPTYSCALVNTDNGIFYKYGIELPEGKEFDAIALVQDSKHGEVVTLKEINIK